MHGKNTSISAVSWNFDNKIEKIPDFTFQRNLGELMVQIEDEYWENPNYTQIQKI